MPVVVGGDARGRGEARLGARAVLVALAGRPLAARARHRAHEARGADPPHAVVPRVRHVHVALPVHRHVLGCPKLGRVGGPVGVPGAPVARQSVHEPLGVELERRRRGRLGPVGRGRVRVGGGVALRGCDGPRVAVLGVVPHVGRHRRVLVRQAVAVGVVLSLRVVVCLEVCLREVQRPVQPVAPATDRALREVGSDVGRRSGHGMGRGRGREEVWIEGGAEALPAAQEHTYVGRRRAPEVPPMRPAHRPGGVGDGGDVVGHLLPRHALELVLDRAVLHLLANMALGLAPVGDALVPHVLQVGVHPAFRLDALLGVLLVRHGPLRLHHRLAPVLLCPRPAEPHRTHQAPLVLPHGHKQAEQHIRPLGPHCWAC
mmetsp:Transcript_47810/g.108504  ORF Transcript_47810/g.108504 Transcript_47810/m.108504 type:complete len:373 (+) Transcript_47810:954-2072(+)